MGPGPDSVYRRLVAPCGVALARPAAADAIADMLARAPLHELAANDPAAVMLGGRGAAWRIAEPGGRGSWVIRHGLRGGAVMGPLLHDRYLRVGEPRPFAEARVSLAARERGVRTPRVVAGVSYAGGLFRRGDVVTEFLEGPTLADAVRGDSTSDRLDRRTALSLAGALVREITRAGVEHADLNATNILLHTRADGVEAWVLDLDRARLHPEPVVSPGVRMLERLRRSLRKLADPALSDAEWAALAEGAGDPLDPLPRKDAR